jgi:23S rRNA (uracil1939-C5)-methyltransferase
MQHLDGESQVAAKQKHLLADLSRIGHAEPAQVLPALRGPQWAYRRRARLGARFVHKKGRMLVGFRERSAPYLADIARCEVLVAPWQDLPARLAALLEGLVLKERIPQVEFAAGDAQAVLVFRVLESLPNADAARLLEFGRVNGVGIYVQSGGLDTVKPLSGEPTELDYVLPTGSAAKTVRLAFEPIDFVQVNAAINVRMVERVLELLSLQTDEAVLDLYCGLGNFSLPLAAAGARVTGVEGDPGLVARARANGERNGCQNLQFHAADLSVPAEWGLWARETYGAVLLDPPRVGAREICERMSQWRPRRVVYISCHTGSLARDAGILTSAGGYRLLAAGVMDMFPHTTHVESIAVFEQAD